MLVRMAQCPLEERLRLTASAHQARRGSIASETELIKRAETRARSCSSASSYQIQIRDAIAKLGVDSILEKAVGPYNVDIALAESSVAVEVHGGGWHSQGTHWVGRPKRIKYLLSRGWLLIEVWAVSPSTLVAANLANQIGAIADLNRRNPATVSQHWMLRGDGDIAPPLRSYGHNVAPVDGASRRDNGTGKYLRVT